MITIHEIQSKFKNSEEILENIFIIKDFASKEEIDCLLQIAQKSTQEDWEKDYLESLKENSSVYSSKEWLDKSLNIENNDLPLILKSRLQEVIKNYSVRQFKTIQRHYPGSHLTEHVDQEHDKSLKYAAVLYLNDNYNGGELYFPKLNFNIKPKNGDLIIFSTGEKYLHGVKTVLDGPTRYAIATFIWSND